MRFIYSIGEGNGIFKWSFFGEREMPLDITKHFEKLEEPSKTKSKENEPMFADLELKTYT